MTLYIVMSWFFLLLTLCKVRSRWLFLFFSFLFFFISASRSFVGSDYKNYYNVYVDFPLDSFIEPFFNYLIIILKHLHLPPQSLFIFVSFFTILFLVLSINNAKISCWFAFFLFITTRGYFDSFNVIRQYLVIAIMLYNIKFLAERDNVKFLIVTFCCTLIHMSAIIYFALFFILNRRFGSVIFVSLILLSMFSVHFNLIPLTLIPSYYSSYINSSHFISSEFSGVGLGFLAFNLIAVVIAINYKVISRSSYMLPYLNMYLLGVIVQNLSFQAIILRRVSISLLIAQIIVIPYFISLVKEPVANFIIKILFLFLFLALFLRGIQIDSNYLSYDWVFND